MVNSLAEALKNLFGNRKYFYGLLIRCFAAILSLAFRRKGKDDFEKARSEILFRKIGHELLVQSGDSISKI